MAGVFSLAAESDWPSCYALDEHLTPGHPLGADVPLHPLVCPLSDSSETGGGLLGAHVNTQLFLSRGETATQLHRDPFDNMYEFPRLLYATTFDCSRHQTSQAFKFLCSALQ